MGSLHFLRAHNCTITGRGLSHNIQVSVNVCGARKYIEEIINICSLDQPETGSIDRISGTCKMSGPGDWVTVHGREQVASELNSMTG